jgi:hypothetical protein
MNEFENRIHGAEFIRPYVIENKKELVDDLNNLEYGMSSRADVEFVNMFYSESIQLVVNAILLMEQGFFDAAMYSLRQSVEVSTTGIFFVDSTKEEREKAIRKWSRLEGNFMEGSMAKALIERQGVYHEVRNALADLFQQFEGVKKELNKYVHKQGFNKFYRIRQQSKYRDQWERQVKEDFSKYIHTTIAAITVLRLIIDPLPIMLGKDDIYRRTGQFMTEYFEEGFVSKYIGEDQLKKYEQTHYYQSYYDAFMVNEEMSPAVLGVIKDEFINRRHLSDIMKQIHLLDKHARIAVALSTFRDDITHIYTALGIIWYFTEAQSKRTNTGFNSNTFTELAPKVPCFNVDYNGVYLSGVSLIDDNYFIQHNDPFPDEACNAILAACTHINNQGKADSSDVYKSQGSA